MAKGRTEVKILRALSGQDNIYTIPKLYVRMTACHVRALILNQIIFYSDKSTRHEDDWFDKSYSEWERETFVKERTLRRIFKEFSKRGWCDTKVELIEGQTKLICRPHIDKILEDAELSLEANTIGQNDRTPQTNCPNPPDKLSVPSYTDEYTDEYTDYSLAHESEKPVSTYPETYYQTPEETKQHLSEQKESDESFEAFWHMYPVKKGKQRAKVSWFSNRCYKQVHMILTKLDEQIHKDRQFIEGYPPHPTTYINNKGWEDEITPLRETKKPSFNQLDQNSDWHKEFHKDRF